MPIGASDEFVNVILTSQRDETIEVRTDNPEFHGPYIVWRDNSGKEIYYQPCRDFAAAVEAIENSGKTLPKEMQEAKYALAGWTI